MRYVGDAWRYAATGLLVSDDPEPACGHCGSRLHRKGTTAAWGRSPASPTPVADTARTMKPMSLWRMAGDWPPGKRWLG